MFWYTYVHTKIAFQLYYVDEMNDNKTTSIIIIIEILIIKDINVCMCTTCAYVTHKYLKIYITK